MEVDYYCSQEGIKQFVHEKIIAKLEEQNPGVVGRHIADVCAEIDDALRPRFVLPLTHVPQTIKRIASVLAAWRAIGAITSVMSTESSSGNMWLPLQTLYREAMKDLEKIAAGEMDLGLVALGNDADNTLGGI